MHRLSLGRVELAVLEDGTLPFAAKAFFSNVPERLWRDEVRPNAEGKIEVGHNCGLVDTGTELIVIDTGYGADTHGGRTGHLLEELARAGRRPEDVTAVINTHAHGDHIKGNTVVRADGARAPAFPNARYVLGRGDWQWFNGPAGRVHEFAEQVALLDRLEMLALADGELQIAPDVRVLPTPGHTPGHASVVVESEGRTAIFLGDLCHHPLHVSQPQWTTELDTHPDTTPRTRASLFDFAAEREALVIFPHAEPPGLGRIERSDRGFRWNALA
ncbi:MAG TPA: MBL fold metallo-hydrolase [Gammaproteobacteria bacterium]